MYLQLATIKIHMCVVALTASIAACKILVARSISKEYFERNNWWGIRVMQFLGLARAIKLVSLAQRFLA